VVGNIFMMFQTLFFNRLKKKWKKHPPKAKKVKPQSQATGEGMHL
jgi:hypothetical protein